VPSFRAAHKQAAYVMRQVLALGTARHAHGHDGQIHSVGTARAYQQVLSQAAQWLKANGHLEGLHRMTPTLAEAYLQERAEYVRQPRPRVMPWQRSSRMWQACGRTSCSRYALLQNNLRHGIGPGR
jgi:hypothetical protein